MVLVVPKRGKYNMATHTTNKILLEFEVGPERKLEALASVLVPVLEGAFVTTSNLRTVCPELVSVSVIFPKRMFCENCTGT